jgi:hypothetical protein
MKFHYPPQGPKPTMMEAFERANTIAAEKRRVKSIIRQEVREIQRERLGPRLKSLEAQRREAEREFATAQASGNAFEMEYFQNKINQAAGEIAGVQKEMGE